MTTIHPLSVLRGSCRLTFKHTLLVSLPIRQRLTWLVLLISLIHLGLGFALGLSGDEAHYALYAANLDWSYYDHPPLVGWVQWPLVALGAPDGVLRLLPNVMWAITAYLVFDIARSLALSQGQSLNEAEGAGLWAVLALAVAPVLHILGIGLLPDTLLMLWTAVVMRHTLHMQAEEAACNTRAWLLLGLCLGLAGLSKYTAVFLALPVVIVLVRAHGWRLLAKPAPWLAVALALVIISPVLAWNATHDWLSFRYQLNHGSGSSWQLGSMLGFFTGQVVLYLGLVWGGWACWRARAELVGFQAWWWVFASPFVVLVYMSGGGTGLPHWTAPAWVALAPLAGAGLQSFWQMGKRRAIKITLGVQAIISAAIFGLMLSAGPTWLSSDGGQPEDINPFTDFYGWQDAARTAQQVAQARGLKHLAVQNWTLASRLAWYARPLPVHVLDDGFDQFSLWSGALPQGDSALLMDWSQMAYQLPVGAGRFERCELVHTQPVLRAGRQVAQFTWHVCEGWGGQPAPQRRERD